MTATPEMKITSLAPWFGGTRSGAAMVGRQLGRLAWCGVPFVGGAPELPHIQTRAGVAADLHRHIINLARCIRDADLKSQLVDRLDGLLVHPDELAGAQRRCLEHGEGDASLFAAPRAMDEPDPAWAADYFVACWMGMGGHAGKMSEFTQGLSVRRTSGGGDSAKRFLSAIESLEAWHLALRAWSFNLMDAFDFLDWAKDEEGHGLYIDAPWPDAGEEYHHRFTYDHHRRLADRLAGFKAARVVIRFGDHPLIRHLYHQDRWTWFEQTTRNQKGNEINEVLILNGPSLAEPQP